MNPRTLMAVIVVCGWAIFESAIGLGGVVSTVMVVTARIGVVLIVGLEMAILIRGRIDANVKRQTQQLRRTLSYPRHPTHVTRHPSTGPRSTPPSPRPTHTPPVVIIRLTSYGWEVEAPGGHSAWRETADGVRKYVADLEKRGAFNGFDQEVGIVWEVGRETRIHRSA